MNNSRHLPKFPLPTSERKDRGAALINAHLEHTVGALFDFLIGASPVYACCAAPDELSEKIKGDRRRPRSRLKEQPRGSLALFSGFDLTLTGAVSLLKS
jgi:hypothetical protein